MSPGQKPGLSYGVHLCLIGKHTHEDEDETHIPAREQPVAATNAERTVRNMAIDPSQRIMRWNAKFKTDRVKAILDDQLAQMQGNVQAVFPMITAMELQVKQVLDGLGVSMAEYSMYLCYGRELWSLVRKEVSGETAAMEADTLRKKWVDRGLTTAVLEAIRTQVFNIAAPTP
jgi:hypothetical protein